MTRADRGSWVGAPFERVNELFDDPSLLATATPIERTAYADIWMEENRERSRRMVKVICGHCEVQPYPTMAGVYDVPKLGPCVDEPTGIHGYLPIAEGQPKYLAELGARQRVSPFPAECVVLADFKERQLDLRCPTCWAPLTLPMADLEAALEAYRRTGKASRPIVVR